MATIEIIKALRNDGFIYCEEMVLTNFVSKGNDHILMFGTWFDTETSSYGNERRVFDAPIELIADNLMGFRAWKIDRFILQGFSEKDSSNENLYKIFEAVQEVKSRLKYDFEAAQENIMQKFD